MSDNFDWRAACLDAERRFREQQARTAEVASLCRDTTNQLIAERNEWFRVADLLYLHVEGASQAYEEALSKSQFSQNER